MNTSNRKKELEEIMRVARKELIEINNAEIIRRNSGLVGKCFRDSESYGDGRRWYRYAMIMQLDGIGFNAWSFERDADGDIRINFSSYHVSIPGKPISHKRFMAEWERLRAEIASAANKLTEVAK